jgi:REP element-mobilizing transposase RayT
MPDHAHVVVGRHDYEIEVIVNLMKGEATKQLNSEGVHPFQGRKGPKNRVPSCFARKWWAVFLDSEEDILRTIKYVEDNPVKAGLKRQAWPFVVKYPGWYEKPKRDEHLSRK